MNRWYFPFLISLLVLSFTPVSSQEEASRMGGPASSESVSRHSTLLNINHLAIWVRNDGLGAHNPFTGSGAPNWGLYYPRSSVGPVGLVYADGIVWVGKVRDGRLPEMRTGGGTWDVGTVPGVILAKGVAENPATPAARVYRVRSDYQTADLGQEASEIFNVPPSAVTAEMIGNLRTQYARDWKEWPWQKGAPFKDMNGNGIMDGDEYPYFLEADQIIWFAYNDLDENVSKSFYGAASTGLEVQVTLWGYKGIREFENVIFKRYRIIYKGSVATAANAVIDSMYLIQWIDIDVGDFADDLGGCDSTLSLGFGYSASNHDPGYKARGLQNPAIGYAILQGPIVPGTTRDEATFDFTSRRGYRNLPMTSFLLNATSDAISEPRYGTPTYWYWNVARGFYPEHGTAVSSRPWIGPTGELTRFPFSGDPVERIGWIDGLGKLWGHPTGVGLSMAPGERRIMLNTGPFRMALGDTQEIVIGIVARMGDGPQSVARVKESTRVLRSIYPFLAETAIELRQKPPAQPAAIPRDFLLLQNYPNPFNPSTRIEFAIPTESDVRLAIYDILGREIVLLEEGWKPAGYYSVLWDGRDQKGREAASGVYFYRLQAGHRELTRKLLIIR